MDVAYILAPVLLIAVVLAAVLLERLSVPVILVALGAGIAFGSDVLNLWPFDNVLLTNQVANMALVFILFHGGFVTKRSDFRAVALPAGGLATWGVLLTAAITYACLRWGLGWSFEKSVLLSVIISSTDAAAIFSILRRQSLPPRLSSTVEIESAANDPMAILLTVVAVTAFASGEADGAAMVVEFFWKFTAGPIVGFLLAKSSLWTFNRLRPQDRGYYYVLFLGVVLLTYGIAEAANASGMLAVFTAGFVMGNRPFVHKQGVLNFSEAISAIANIGMFVLMGLLVFPRDWSGLWVQGTLLFLVLTFVARPLAVFLGTMGMRFGTKNKLFASWAGLRGAVPIVLATYPSAAGLALGEEVFNLVFFAVLLSILIQGSTMGTLAKWMGLSEPSRPKPLFNLDLITMAHSDYDLFAVDLPDPRGAPGPRIRDLNLPEGSVITLVTRGTEVVIPKGNTRLQGWDQVTVLAHAPDEDRVRAALLEPFTAKEADAAEALPSTT
ncbi:potassium/proton antiporter [Vulgatibacter incomptus]|uniref:Sodium/hydrogen exchanger n=1 Tax=Vulgatibacter incomptus TaxID=1391653 RepID=A0A0K1PES3_9BACT|nr:potassium/proton antiporter [Vulgatibacter incomptus]AKU92033.1 Sodium/hydrogen exchanger [Vulgatibacter incomptus]